MTKRMRSILVSCAALVVIPLAALIAWQMWRDHALLGFCKEVRAGISFAELTSLEKRHWIGESFLVEARFKDYVDQAHSPSLEFRSQWFDPGFVCVITHDGNTVMNVQLLTLEGFDSK